MTKEPNTEDATGNFTTHGKAPKTVKRLSPAQAQARKEELVKEILQLSKLQMVQTMRVPYTEPREVGLRLIRSIYRYPLVNSETKGPYLATVGSWWGPKHTAFGVSEIGALKALRNYLKAHP